MACRWYPAVISCGEEVSGTGYAWALIDRRRRTLNVRVNVNSQGFQPVGYDTIETTSLYMLMRPKAKEHAWCPTFQQSGS